MQFKILAKHYQLYQPRSRKNKIFWKPVKGIILKCSFNKNQKEKVQSRACHDGPKGVELYLKPSIHFFNLDARLR